MDEKTRDIEAQLDQLLEDDRPEAPAEAAPEPAPTGSEQLETAIDQALDVAQQSVHDLAEEIEPLVGAFETIEDVVGTDNDESEPAETEDPANVVARELEDSEIGDIERTLEAETEALGHEVAATSQPSTPVPAAAAPPTSAPLSPPAAAAPPPPPATAPADPPSAPDAVSRTTGDVGLPLVGSSSPLVQRLARLNGPLLHCAEGTRDLVGLAALTTLAMAGGLLLKAAGVGGLVFLGACVALVLPVLGLFYLRFVRPGYEGGEPPAQTPSATDA